MERRWKGPEGCRHRVARVPAFTAVSLTSHDGG
jgi:hypothetical protein